MTSGEVTLTREQLYQFIWNEPISTVALRYGLSDRGLAKICMRLNVPVPGRGHWQMKAAGKAVFRPRLRPLPPTTPPQERQITLNPSSPRIGIRGPNSAAGRQDVVETKADRIIQVPPELVDAHPLVERTAKTLRRAKADERKVLVPEAKSGLDVRVTRSSLDRALRIVDALVKALEVRGFVVTCTEDDQRRTSVTVFDEQITFYLEEGIRDEKRVEKRRVTRDMFSYAFNPLATVDYVVHDYTATGELALRIADEDFLGTRRSWRDGKRQRLERLLNRFIVGLVATAEARKAERERREAREKEWEERRRLEVEQARLRAEEERRIRHLKEDLAAWHSSRHIREYVAAVRAGADPRCTSDEERCALDQWLKWATERADRLDPTLRATAPRDAQCAGG